MSTGSNAMYLTIRPLNLLYQKSFSNVQSPLYCTTESSLLSSSIQKISSSALHTRNNSLFFPYNGPKISELCSRQPSPPMYVTIFPLFLKASLGDGGSNEHHDEFYAPPKLPKSWWLILLSPNATIYLPRTIALYKRTILTSCFDHLFFSLFQVTTWAVTTRSLLLFSPISLPVVVLALWKHVPATHLIQSKSECNLAETMV